MNRRELLAASAAATMAAIAPKAYANPSAKKRRVGLIGPGWYGKCDLTRLLQIEPVEVVALCDVDRHMLTEAGELIASRQESKQKPRLHGDYREMLAEQDCDIVLVDTPDHWHALPAIAAMESGADVWVQKPASLVSVPKLNSHYKSRSICENNSLKNEPFSWFAR